MLLHNTGGVTQAFSSLRKGILSSMPPPDNDQLLDKLELVSPAPWSTKFGLPEIHMLKELNQRAPMLLRTTVVMVDVMKDSSEEILSTLTCCFAGGGGVPELGLGEAEMLCILTAWKRHMTLIANATVYERYADMLQIALYMLAVVTTLLAVLYTIAANDVKAAEKEYTDWLAAQAVDEEVERRVRRALATTIIGCYPPMAPPPSEPPCPPPPEWPPPLVPPLAPPFPPPLPMPPVDTSLKDTLSLVMILLPILAAFLGSVKSKVRPREKWSTCLMAAHQIVSQIYYYRLRTEKFDVNAPPASEDEEPVDPKKKQMMARQKFVDTCSEIYGMAISTEISKGGALKIDKVAKMQQ